MILPVIVITIMDAQYLRPLFLRLLVRGNRENKGRAKIQGLQYLPHMTDAVTRGVLWPEMNLDTSVKPVQVSRCYRKVAIYHTLFTLKNFISSSLPLSQVAETYLSYIIYNPISWFICIKQQMCSMKKILLQTYLITKAAHSFFIVHMYAFCRLCSKLSCTTNSTVVHNTETCHLNYMIQRCGCATKTNAI